MGKSTTACGVLAALSPPHWAVLKPALAASQLTRFPQGRRPHPHAVRRALVLAPPHLLTTWAEEIRATLPGATIQVLDGVTAVDRFAHTAAPPVAPPAGPGTGLVIGLLSREAAKLSYALRPALEEDRCPRCGHPIPEPAEQIVKQRLRCRHQAIRPRNRAARIGLELAALLYPLYPQEPRITQLIQARYLHHQAQRAGGDPGTLRARWLQRATGPELGRSPGDRLLTAWLAALPVRATTPRDPHWVETWGRIYRGLSLALDHPDRDAFLAPGLGQLYGISLADPVNSRIIWVLRPFW